MRPRRSRDQAGYAVVWGVAWIAVCAAVGWLGVLLAFGVCAQHHLDGAADLSAVSGASVLQQGGDGCGEASTVAAANHVELASCRVLGDDLVVGTESVLRLPFGLSLRIRAEARAGPP